MVHAVYFVRFCVCFLFSLLKATVRACLSLVCLNNNNNNIADNVYDIVVARVHPEVQFGLNADFLVEK